VVVERKVTQADLLVDLEALAVVAVVHTFAMLALVLHTQHLQEPLIQAVAEAAVLAITIT